MLLLDEKVSLLPIVEFNFVGILKVKSLVFFVSSAPMGAGWALFLSLTDFCALRSGSVFNALGLSEGIRAGIEAFYCSCNSSGRTISGYYDGLGDSIRG